MSTSHRTDNRDTWTQDRVEKCLFKIEEFISLCDRTTNERRVGRKIVDKIIKDEEMDIEIWKSHSYRNIARRIAVHAKKAVVIFARVDVANSGCSVSLQLIM